MTVEPTGFPGSDSTGTEWPGPGLFVPVAVEALVLTKRAYVGEPYGRWSWAPRNYKLLSSYDPPVKDPLKAQFPDLLEQAAFTGVVLHWALPDGLTQGAETGGGHVVYPAIPNRWLVVRKSRAPKDPAAWVYRAWVIASDWREQYVELGSAFYNPAWTGDKGADPQIGLGKSWPIEEWPGEAVASAHALQPPLTALGASDPTFAAFVPNVVNILSFPDPLDDVAAGPISYSVYGWYSAPELDPLYGAATFGTDGWQTAEQWKNLMSRLNWSVGDAQDLDHAVEAGQDWAKEHGFAPDPSRPRSRLPSRTICHGLLFNVGWEGPDAPFASGAPPVNPNGPGYLKPKVALANDAIDAIAAMIAESEKGKLTEAQIRRLLQILEAFQYDSLPLLDRADADAQISVLKQTGWFNATGNRCTWDVVDPRPTDAPSGRARPPSLTPEQAEALTHLNEAQQQLDASGERLASLQWDLFALWWKQQKLGTIKNPPPKWKTLIEDARPNAIKAAAAEIADYKTLMQQRDGLRDRLRESLGRMELREGAGPSSWRPNDPSVVINGARRVYKHGEDGRFTPDGALFCRFTGQTVAGIQVDVSGNPVILHRGDFDLPTWAPPDFPLEVQQGDLDAEAFFLDVTDAPLIATKADPANPWPLLDGIRKEQTLIWNPDLHAALDRQTIAEASGLQTMYGLGAIPSKAGVHVWAPPWAPLFLVWAVTVYPGSSSQEVALENWELPSPWEDGNPETDFAYRWKPPLQEPTGSFQVVGRTLLTPEPAALLAARIERLIRSGGAGDYDWALQDALDYVRNADLLAQVLTGFNLALLQRSAPGFITWEGSDPSLDPYLNPPDAPHLAANSAPKPGAGLVEFNPIRTGHARVETLWVVDGFGQVFDVISAMGLSPDNFEPILDTDLQTASDPKFLELKPRITQFADLRFPLLSAEDDAQEVGVATDANPVCGWLLPNRLDGGLLVYDAAGNLQGELLSAETIAVWSPAPEDYPPPGSGAPPGVEIRNRHLRALIEGILARSDSLQSLEALLGLIDTAEYAIEPGDDWPELELPALLGRPLAVVRARLQFELSGEPAYSQAWDDTGRSITAGFDKVRFGIQLGNTELLDDGLIGYYLNDQYSTINTPYGPKSGTPYLAAERPALPFDGAGAALLTLVLDPRGKAHAITGIMPVLSAGLPPVFITPLLRRLRVLFRTGPVLSETAAARLPLPEVRDGAWYWTQYHLDPVPATSVPVLPGDPTPRLPDVPPALQEGWLTLILGGATKLSYSVSPDAVVYTTDSKDPSVTSVSFTVHNGTDKDVPCSAIGFSVPVGQYSSDLTADPAAIVARVVGGAAWSFVSDQKGRFTAAPTPPARPVAPGETVTLVLERVCVNDTAGSVLVMIEESTAASNGGPPGDEVPWTTVGMDKVPPSA
jgi:hypothetical protein